MTVLIYIHKKKREDFLGGDIMYNDIGYIFGTKRYLNWHVLFVHLSTLSPL